jgi:hypothetical protein
MSMPEPERELVRRAIPFAIPAFALAFAIGALLGGRDDAWSAALGIVVVAANFAANGLSLAWAARISPNALFGVAMGGFAVRLGAVLVVMLLLNRLAFFSPVAFVAALVPATIALLVLEIRLLSGRFTADLWTFPTGSTGAQR